VKGCYINTQLQSVSAGEGHVETNIVMSQLSEKLTLIVNAFFFISDCSDDIMAFLSQQFQFL